MTIWFCCNIFLKASSVLILHNHSGCVFHQKRRELNLIFFKHIGTPRSELLEEVECAPSPRLALTLKVAGLGTSREVELPLSNYRATIFCYVQKLLQFSCNGNIKSDKLRRIWEPTYT